MNKFEKISFKNNIGQNINAGDKILYVGTSRKNIIINEGIYEGSYINSNNTVTAVKISNISDKRLRYNQDTKKYEYSNCLRNAILPLKRIYKLENIT